MQAAPAISADLDDGRPERVLISLLHALTGVAVAAWAEGLLEVTSSVQGMIVAVVAGVASALLGAGLARLALPGNAQCLRWDGQAWSLVLRAPVGGLGVEIAVAHLVVSIDLGPWLLLRAYAAAGGSRVLRGGRRLAWITRGLESPHRQGPVKPGRPAPAVMGCP